MPNTDILIEDTTFGYVIETFSQFGTYHNPLIYMNMQTEGNKSIYAVDNKYGEKPSVQVLNDVFIIRDNTLWKTPTMKVDGPHGHGPAAIVVGETIWTRNLTFVEEITDEYLRGAGLESVWIHGRH